MWFKKHFFEPSLRVPLLMKIPNVTTGRITTHVSLVDLLPTFMGIAEGTGWASKIEDLDGIDLTTLIENEQPDRAVFAEYLAEATAAPIFMIRRGKYKFVSSADDPPLLFDLIADPDERTNLANDPSFANQVSQFLLETSQKWNHNEEATSDVIWYRGDGGYNEWAFSYLPVLVEDT